MNLDDVPVILDKIKYKDWTFRAMVRYGTDLTIVVSHDVPDSDEVFAGVEEPRVGPTTTTTMLNHAAFSTRPLEELILDQVWQMIRNMELHEAGEWFIYDGRRPHYPHAPKVEGFPVGRLNAIISDEGPIPFVGNNPCAEIDLSHDLSPWRA